MVVLPWESRTREVALQVPAPQGFFPLPGGASTLEWGPFCLYNSRRPNQDDFQVARKHAAKVVETKVGKRGD